MYDVKIKYICKFSRMKHAIMYILLKYKHDSIIYKYLQEIKLNLYFFIDIHQKY